MVKKFIAALLSRLTGKNITPEMIDTFLAFLGMLIEIFGSPDAAMKYMVRQVQLVRRIDDKKKARAVFEGTEVSLQKVIQES